MKTNKEVYKFKFFDTKQFETEVIIGLNILNNLQDLAILNGVRKESKHLIVTDTNLEKLYLDRVLSNMKNIGYELCPLIVPATDNSKSLSTYIELVDQSLEYGFDKYSVVFSLGGGVVNNLAGFLASTLYRGIGLIHIPTSLLAQVDAAISFKQAINHKYGKNLIGSYYAPSKIIVDPSVLSTLDIRFLRDGLAEAIKHALCQDIGFFDYLQEYKNDLYDLTFLEKVISESIRLKMEVMDGDVTPLESDYNESIKHYGHTVGHAIEHISAGKMYHGEAISIGMCVSAEVSYLLGYCDKATVQMHYDVFTNLGLPIFIPDEYSNDKIWERIHYDKHFLDGKAYFGLVESIGTMSLYQENVYGYYIKKEIVLEAIEVNKRRRKIIN